MAELGRFLKANTIGRAMSIADRQYQAQVVPRLQIIERRQRIEQARQYGANRALAQYAAQAPSQVPPTLAAAAQAADIPLPSPALTGLGSPEEEESSQTPGGQGRALLVGGGLLALALYFSQ